MINMKKILIALLFPMCIFAQDDLLSEIDVQKNDIQVVSAFKSLKIVNFESTKLIGKGDFYFVVAHRFDYLNRGFDDFFGLKDLLTIHIARSGFQETYDLGVKYLLVSQKEEGFPFAIVGFNSLAINTELKKVNYPLVEFKDRLTYVSQLLISRKFTDKLSLEVAPTYFHENTVRDILDENNSVIKPNPQDNSQFAIGVGGRYKFAKRWSVNMDYGAHLNRAKESIYKNPLSIGVDLETGGHVFQMHFTNAKAMHESGFLGQTTGDWGKGEIAFGFNLVRVF